MRRMGMKRIGLLAGSGLLTVTALCGAAGVQAQTAGSHQAPAKRAPALTATVVVNEKRVMGIVPPLAYGMNTAVWDGNLYTAAVPGRLKQLGIRLLRWPGGSTADTYHWDSALFEFNQFMQLSRQVGALPLLTVNYGTGSPQEAGKWVAYVVKHHENAWWEIGNEVYGNGTYQHVVWEADYHTQKGPAAYGHNSLQFIAAMRKADPHAQIGIVATIPGFWPSDIKPYWDRTLLPIVGKEINFVVIHWYPQNPGSESDAGLLSSTDAVAAYMSQLKQYLKQYCGANAKNIKVLLDETNSVSSNPGKQTMSVVNALFLANDYNTWLENGVANVSWWDLHNNATAGNMSPTLFGTAKYGDYGILSAGDTGEPPINTPTASFWGLRMVNLFAQPGDRYVEASSNQSLVDVYAAKRGKSGTSVMVVNTSPNASYQVSLRGLKVPAAKMTEYVYGEKTAAIQELQVPYGHGTVVVPPYTMVVLALQ